MQFSSAIRANLEAFAGNMKLAYEPSSDGSVSYLLSQSGLVTFTPIKGGSQLVVSLAREVGGNALQSAEGLLNAAGERPELGHVLHAGLSKDGMQHLAIVLEERQISPAVLEQIVDTLIGEMAKH